MKRDLSLSMGIPHRVDREDNCEATCPACKVLKVLDSEKRLKAEVRRLRAENRDLRLYGTHTRGCMTQTGGYGCTCGWAALRPAKRGAK